MEIAEFLKTVGCKCDSCKHTGKFEEFTYQSDEVKTIPDFWIERTIRFLKNEGVISEDIYFKCPKCESLHIDLFFSHIEMVNFISDCSTSSADLIGRLVTIQNGPDECCIVCQVLDNAKLPDEYIAIDTSGNLMKIVKDKILRYTNIRDL